MWGLVDHIKDFDLYSKRTRKALKVFMRVLKNIMTGKYLYTQQKGEGFRNHNQR